MLLFHQEQYVSILNNLIKKTKVIFDIYEKYALLLGKMYVIGFFLNYTHNLTS